MLSRLPKNFFSLKIFTHLSFTDGFYSAVEQRLLPKGKHLMLDIKPGDGCGGFSYEFKAVPEPTDTSLMFVN